MPSHTGSLRNWVKGFPHFDLIWDFDRFGLCCLLLKRLNNHPVVAHGVVVVAKFDIFS
jgi:hypothetical protein